MDLRLEFVAARCIPSTHCCPPHNSNSRRRGVVGQTSFGELICKLEHYLFLLLQNFLVSQLSTCCSLCVLSSRMPLLRTLQRTFRFPIPRFGVVSSGKLPPTLSAEECIGVAKSKARQQVTRNYGIQNGVLQVQSHDVCSSHPSPLTALTFPRLRVKDPKVSSKGPLPPNRSQTALS